MGSFLFKVEGDHGDVFVAPAFFQGQCQSVEDLPKHDMVRTLAVFVYLQGENLLALQIAGYRKGFAQGGGQRRLGMIQPLIGTHAAGLFHPGTGEGLAV